MTRSASPRSLLALCLGVFSACPPAKTETTWFDVTVKHPASLASVCVKVTVTGGGIIQESAPLPASGADDLNVLIYQENLPVSVTLKAIGYSDAECTTPSFPSEESAIERAGFATPPAKITLLLVRAQTIDTDGDGFSPPVDCNDSNPGVKPGVPERCDDQIDNDCNASIDCAETSCDLDACGTGAVCMNTKCAESACGDRIDGDRDGTTDCADTDCADKACGAGVAGAGAQCVGTTCREQRHRRRARWAGRLWRRRLSGRDVRHGRHLRGLARWRRPFELPRAERDALR
ncbi:MAG: putative metal-binding motif-containing protein [Archangium sp.]|nr:putative metal-binding motif-containing protein [Archangium sp.]MDP3571211.1 putative metal-binding motif-containing protein [Archangium sp.]